MRKAKVLGGRYRLGEELGTGSLGRVFEAHHTALSQEAAAKVILEEVAIAAGGPRRMLARVKAVARVHHRNLVEIHDMGEVDNTLYVVTERMPARTLHDHLRQEGRLRRGALSPPQSTRPAVTKRLYQAIRGTTVEAELGTGGYAEAVQGKLATRLAAEPFNGGAASAAPATSLRPRPRP